MGNKLKKCKECGWEFNKVDLSRKGLCHECAKERLLEAFDTMWAKSIKRGGPNAV